MGQFCASEHVTGRYKAKAYVDGKWIEKEISLTEEYWLDVYVNEILRYHIVCSSSNLRELLVGRMFTDGLICCGEELEDLRIESEKNCAYVYLKDGIVKPFFRNTSSSALWKPEWILALYEKLQYGLPLYRQTISVHSCLLMQEGEILCCMEDVSRHNTLDKVIGWAMEHDIDLCRCILFSSGRQSVDMVEKVIHAGVPVLVSKSLPTISAVQCAKAHGLTLLHVSERRGFLQLV